LIAVQNKNNIFNLCGCINTTNNQTYKNKNRQLEHKILSFNNL